MVRHLTIFGILCLPLAAAVAQSDLGPPRWAANLARKQQVVMHGVPQPYRGLRDPSPDVVAKLRRGREVFDSQCSSCHGRGGQGDGPDAYALVPAPADLEWLTGAPEAAAEPYLYWSIAEGGARFQSEMPAYKDRLSRRDTWAVIAYIQSGMPGRSP